MHLLGCRQICYLWNSWIIRNRQSDPKPLLETPAWGRIALPGQIPKGTVKHPFLLQKAMRLEVLFVFSLSSSIISRNGKNSRKKIFHSLSSSITIVCLSLNGRCYSNNQQTVSHFRIKDNGNMKRFQVGKFDSMIRSYPTTNLNPVMTWGLEDCFPLKLLMKWGLC